MSKKPCSDPRLPHRLQEWADSHGRRPTESDGEAIAAWLRSLRGTEYSRKPADGLRRQVVRLIARSAPITPSANLAIGGAGSVGAQLSWALDTTANGALGLTPDAVKRPAPEADATRSAKAARGAEGSQSPLRDYNLLNASVAKSYRSLEPEMMTDREAQSEGALAEALPPAAEDLPTAAEGTVSDAAAASDAPMVAIAAAATGKKRGRRERRGSERTTQAEAPLVSYADLGGMEGPLQAVRELVEYPLTHPEIYAHLGVAPPRGLLLHGPPGCGKTLLACAIAGELGVGFVRISAPEVVSGMSGESEAKIRQVFREAREVAPALLFIDEIDAIAPKRESAQREMEKRIVAQMLTCMDELAAGGGSQFDSTTSGGTPGAANPIVIVIGATNRPDALDPALRRAGRFDREIALGIPDAAARGRILQVKLRTSTPQLFAASARPLCACSFAARARRHQVMTRGMRLAPDVDVHEIARRCIGFVGADLAALCKEAAVVAVNRIFGELFARPAREEAPAEVAGADAKELIVTPTTTLGGGEAVSAELSRGMAASAVLRRSGALTAEELAPLAVDMSDFEAGMTKVQPSAKREGFATVPNVTWADVGALADLREELLTLIVEPVREPGRMQALGLDPSCGVLLYGPPGCGKTLLAKAVANESGASFMSVSGPELLNKYVGESERAVRLLFARGRASAPCVIFFDELDALVPRRGSESGSQATERVVNQLLTEMDGLENRNSVFIVGATNRPDIIDPAMLRPGRLDKLLYVPLPPAEARADILRAASRKTPLAEDVDLEALGRDPRCEGFSGADLAALVREAAVCALRDMRLAAERPSAPLVHHAHFDAALEVVQPSVSAKDEASYRALSTRLRKRRGPPDKSARATVGGGPAISEPEAN